MSGRPGNPLSARRALAHVVLAVCCFLAVAAAQQHTGPATPGVILHVDAGAPTGGDGLTWTTPFRHVQDALEAARQPASGVSEIRIAQGEYKPDQGATVTPGDIHATFWIPPGLHVAGGYAGVTQPDPDARDTAIYVTTFSGDLLGDDGPIGTFTNTDDNSIHISRIRSEGFKAPPARFSGIRFIRSRSYFSPDNSGGAINCVLARMVVDDCRFEGNSASQGAVGIVDGEAIVTTSKFSLNNGFYGGAVYTLRADATFTSCAFVRNRASWNGGAVKASGTSSLTFDRCDFTANTAEFATGGAIEAHSSGSVNLNRCTMYDNRGDFAGAVSGMMDAENCDFIANRAYNVGALQQYGGTLRHCRFMHNLSADGSGAAAGLNGRYLNCLFFENESIYRGGGAFIGSGAFINCQFLRNYCDLGGGAVSLTYLDSSFVNCVFSGNHSIASGGAIRLAATVDSAALINCTLFGNTSNGAGSAVSGPAQIACSIVWGHAGQMFDQIGPVSFSCVEGGWTGEGNSSADPMFVDPLGPDGVTGTLDDNHRVRAGSSCIDAGSNLLLPLDEYDLDADGNLAEPLPCDLDGALRLVNDPRAPDTGQPRRAQAIVDRGAYEFHDFERIIGDATGDGVVNVDDLILVVISWGPCPIPPDDCRADVAPVATGGNGVVDIDDPLLVIEAWSDL